MNCWNCLTVFLSRILQQERIKVKQTMIENIAQSAMNLSSAKLSMAYATSVTKMAMDTQDTAIDAIKQMLPPTPSKGHYIDTYA